MGNNTSSTQHNLKEQYSDKDIQNLVKQMLLHNKNNNTSFDETLNFNTDEHILVGGKNKFSSNKNRYDKYQTGGYNSELYTDLNSDTFNYDDMSNVNDNEINNNVTKLLSFFNMSGGTQNSNELTSDTLGSFNMNIDSQEYNEFTDDQSLNNLLYNINGGADDSNEYNELATDTMGTFKNHLHNLSGGNCPCAGNNNIGLSGGAKKKNKKNDTNNSENTDDNDLLDEDEDEEDEDLASELEEDIDELDTDEESESNSSRSFMSKSSRSVKSKSSNKKSLKYNSKNNPKYNSEYSLTNSNSSTINIVPFYSTPSDSEYYNHLKNKNRFA